MFKSALYTYVHNMSIYILKIPVDAELKKIIYHIVLTAKFIVSHAYNTTRHLESCCYTITLFT